MRALHLAVHHRSTINVIIAFSRSCCCRTRASKSGLSCQKSTNLCGVVYEAIERYRINFMLPSFLTVPELPSSEELLIDEILAFDFRQ